MTEERDVHFPNAYARTDVTESGMSYTPPTPLHPAGNCIREVISELNKTPSTEVKYSFPSSIKIFSRCCGIYKKKVWR